MSNPAAPPHAPGLRRRLLPLAALAVLVLQACGGADGRGAGPGASGPGDVAVPAPSPSPPPSPAPAPAPAPPPAPPIAPPGEGRWDPPVDLGFVPAAGANLPAGAGEGAGRVVMWSAQNRFGYSVEGETGDASITYTAVYDASTGQSTPAREDATGHQMFCPGTTNLPDGRLLVAGGSTSRVSSVYDPLADTWRRSPGAALQIPRGYQAQTLLRDGSVLTLGGSWNGGLGGKDGERWTEADGWQRLPGVTAEGLLTADPAGLYRSDNQMWLKPVGDGRVLHVGPARRMHWIDPRDGGTVVPTVPRGDSADAMNGTAVMFEPGRILVAGGATAYDDAPASAAAYRVDVTGVEPVVARLPDMAWTRVFHSGVVLPDGRVLVVGGKDRAVPFVDDGARLAPELWDPDSGRFTALPPMRVPRTYHSWALLLPDARVLVAGGGLCGCAGDQPTHEIFSPHYLFDADGRAAVRPRITAAPAQAAYGTEIEVRTDAPVAGFALVRLSSATHTVNNDQRRVPLAVVSSAGDRYRLAMPANPGWAVPGAWMLFALDARGVPSLARTVRLDRFGAPLVAPLVERAATVGRPVAVAPASATPGAAARFSATGLPPGLAVDAATGAFSGTPTVAGRFRATVTARNDAGATATDVVWSVGPAGGALGTGLR